MSEIIKLCRSIVTVNLDRVILCNIDINSYIAHISLDWGFMLHKMTRLKFTVNIGEIIN